MNFHIVYTKLFKTVVLNLIVQNSLTKNINVNMCIFIILVKKSFNENPFSHTNHFLAQPQLLPSFEIVPTSTQS